MLLKFEHWCTSHFEADVILVDIEVEEMWVKCEVEFWNIVKEEAHAQGHFIRYIDRNIFYSECHLIHAALLARFYVLVVEANYDWRYGLESRVVKVTAQIGWTRWIGFGLEIELEVRQQR